MYLTPKELDRLTIFLLAELARRSRARGLKLNYTEAAALICDAVFEEARAGRPYDEVVARARSLLTGHDVLPGVPEMLSILQIDALFPDGTRLVTIRNPIAPVENEESQPGTTPPHHEKGASVPAFPISNQGQQTGEHTLGFQSVRDRGIPPGGLYPGEAEVEINAGLPVTRVCITNRGDVPVHLTAHFHVFEANPALCFDRRKALGMRPDIPVGWAIRIEPGQTVEVPLVPIGGQRIVRSFHGLVDGPLDEVDRESLLSELVSRGFCHEPSE